MQLNRLMDYVGDLCFSAKQIEQAEDRLDSLYESKCIAQREREVPGNSEYVESDAYLDNLIKEQEKILESNTIEKIFEKESLSEEEIEILYHFREDLSKIENDYVYILSCEDRDLANPTYEAVLFAKHIGSHPALKDIELTQELAKEICDASEYICKEYVYCNYDEDVVYRKSEIADVMDELLSICPNLKKVIENQKESLSTTLYLNEEYRAKLEAFTGRSIEGPDDFADVIWQMVDERLGILPVAKEMSVETELGEIVVREKVDTNYPGVMIDLRGERANDLFEAGMAALATIEFDPETKGIRMDVYQDGDSEERTDSITFENVLKDAVPVKDTVRLNIGHYIDNDFSPSRVTTFLVRIQDLEDYLEQSEDDRTGEEFYQTYDSDEAQVLYEYMSDDGKILDEEVTYCDAFEKDYADYIKRTQMFNPGMSAEQIATKENYYWNVYVNVAEPSLKKEKQRPLVEQIQDAKNVKQEKQNDAGKMAGRGNLER